MKDKVLSIIIVIVMMMIAPTCFGQEEIVEEFTGLDSKNCFHDRFGQPCYKLFIYEDMSKSIMVYLILEDIDSRSRSMIVKAKQSDITKAFVTKLIEQGCQVEQMEVELE